MVNPPLLPHAQRLFKREYLRCGIDTPSSRSRNPSASVNSRIIVRLTDLLSSIRHRNVSNPTRHVVHGRRQRCRRPEDIAPPPRSACHAASWFGHGARGQSGFRPPLIRTLRCRHKRRRCTASDKPAAPINAALSSRQCYCSAACALWNVSLSCHSAIPSNNPRHRLRIRNLRIKNLKTRKF